MKTITSNNKKIMLIIYISILPVDRTIKGTNNHSRSGSNDNEVLNPIHPKNCRGFPRGVMVKAMDYGIEDFVLQSRYYVHFRANNLILPAMGWIVPPLFF